MGSSSEELMSTPMRLTRSLCCARAASGQAAAARRTGEGTDAALPAPPAPPVDASLKSVITFSDALAQGAQLRAPLLKK
jgi:hypothetical protein